jgi:hypothetical protein
MAGASARRVLLNKKIAVKPANTRNTAAHAIARHADFRRGVIERCGKIVGSLAASGCVRSTMRNRTPLGGCVAANDFLMSARTSSTIAASGTGAASRPAIWEFSRVVSRKRAANVGSASNATNSVASASDSAASR